MNQKKFFQFNPKPSEKDLAFREELPEGHPFSDEVQFAKAENVDLRRKHAATAQALGFDIETGRRVGAPQRPALNVAPDVPRYESRKAQGEKADRQRESIGRESLDPDLRRYQVDEDFSRFNPYRTPNQNGPQWVWKARGRVPAGSEYINVTGTRQTDDDALNLKFPEIERGSKREHIFVSYGDGFFEVPVQKIEDSDPNDGVTESRWKADLSGIDTSRIVAVLHTHPREVKDENGRIEVPAGQQQWNISPSGKVNNVDGDYKVVVDGVPNYIEHEGRIGVLEIVDGRWQFRMLRGENFDDRNRTHESEIIQRRVNKFQSKKYGLTQ